MTKALAGTGIEIPAEMALWSARISSLRDSVRQSRRSAATAGGCWHRIRIALPDAAAPSGSLSVSRATSAVTFPVTERVTSRILSLPMYPGIRLEAVERVASELRESCHVG